MIVPELGFDPEQGHEHLPGEDSRLFEKINLLETTRQTAFAIFLGMATERNDNNTGLTRIFVYEHDNHLYLELFYGP